MPTIPGRNTNPDHRRRARSPGRGGPVLAPPAERGRTRQRRRTGRICWNALVNQIFRDIGGGKSGGLLREVAVSFVLGWRGFRGGGRFGAGGDRLSGSGCGGGAVLGRNGRILLQLRHRGDGTCEFYFFVLHADTGAGGMVVPLGRRVHTIMIQRQGLDQGGTLTCKKTKVFS